MTTTERDVQKRLVDLSVVTLSALVLGGGYVLASRVDHERARVAAPAQEQQLNPPAETVQLASASAVVADAPPVPGLQPAPRPTRRVVVVRRTRAS